MTCGRENSKQANLNLDPLFDLVKRLANTYFDGLFYYFGELFGVFLEFLLERSTHHIPCRNIPGLGDVFRKGSLKSIFSLKLGGLKTPRQIPERGMILLTGSCHFQQIHLFGYRLFIYFN